VTRTTDTKEPLHPPSGPSELALTSPAWRCAGTPRQAARVLCTIEWPNRATVSRGPLMLKSPHSFRRTTHLGSRQESGRGSASFGPRDVRLDTPEAHNSTAFELGHRGEAHQRRGRSWVCLARALRAEPARSCSTQKQACRGAHGVGCRSMVMGDGLPSPSSQGGRRGASFNFQHQGMATVHVGTGNVDR
jgi:hypothetical protein